MAHGPWLGVVSDLLVTRGDGVQSVHPPPCKMLRTFAYTTFDGPQVVSVIVGSDGSDSSGSAGVGGDGAGSARVAQPRAGDSCTSGASPASSLRRSRPPTIRRMGTVRLRALSTCRIVGVTLRRESMWSFWHEYHVHVTTMFGAHTVRRRYREFAELRDQLEVAYARRHARVGFFPRKMLVGSSAPAVVAHRRMALEAYLSALLRDRVMRRSRQLVAFLRLDSLWASAATQCLAAAADTRKGQEVPHAQLAAAAQLVAAAPDARIDPHDAVLRALRRVRGESHARSPANDGDEVGDGSRWRAATAPRAIRGAAPARTRRGVPSPGRRRASTIDGAWRGGTEPTDACGSPEDPRLAFGVHHLATMLAHSLQASPPRADGDGAPHGTRGDAGSSGGTRSTAHTSAGSGGIRARFEGEVRGADVGGVSRAPLQRASTFMGWSSALGRGWQPRRGRSDSSHGVCDGMGGTSMGARVTSQHDRVQLGGRGFESLGHQTYVPSADAHRHMSGVSSGASSLDSDRFASDMQSPQGLGVGNVFSATPPSSFRSFGEAGSGGAVDAAQSPPSHRESGSGEWRALDSVLAARHNGDDASLHAVSHTASDADAGAGPSVVAHGGDGSANAPVASVAAERRGSVGYGTTAQRVAGSPRSPGAVSGASTADDARRTSDAPVRAQRSGLPTPLPAPVYAGEVTPATHVRGAPMHARTRARASARVCIPAVAPRPMFPGFQSRARPSSALLASSA